jgi:hypothetical protein
MPEESPLKEFFISYTGTDRARAEWKGMISLNGRSTRRPNPSCSGR